MEPALNRVKEFKATFGIKEKANGEIHIDFEKLVENIGMEGAFELRQIIDERYHISGKPGEKPHLRV
jgi:hypothetical protein